MKAAWYVRNGPPHEVLTIGELPEPAPAKGEVLVRVAYSGINPSDVKRRAGWRSQVPAFATTVPHNDGSGVIVAVGEGVDPRRCGERVWLHSTGWKRPLGTAAELTVTSSRRAIRLPDSTTFAQGAALGVPALTAHRAVFGFGEVHGKRVLIAGGAGAVGFFAIQFAKRGGADVIATVSSGEKGEIARRAGADWIVNYRTEPVEARVLELTAGQGIDHVIEVDFGANAELDLALLRPHGSIAAYASMSNPTPSIRFYDWMTKNLRMLWVFVYEMPQTALDEATREIVAWLEGGQAVHPPMTVYPLEHVADAHVAVESGTTGKVLLEIGGEGVRA